MKSREIAISAISASFITILLSLGAYFQVVDLIAVVFASVLTLLPLSKNWRLAGFLTYLAGGLLAFVISGFNYLSLVFPSYFLLFGLFPIIKNIMDEKVVKKPIKYTIGIIWFVAVSIGLYFYYTLLMGLQVNFRFEWLNKFALPIVAVVGLVLFFIYEHFINSSKAFIARYVDKFIKK